MTTLSHSTGETPTAPDVHRKFETWVATVRDPATAATEGVRRIATKKAEACYQIAPLPDGRFALQYDLSYKTGDCHGHETPWREYATRDECVHAFIEAARKHFSRPVGQSRYEEDAGDGYRAQREAQQQMLQLLAGEGLFGFMEPEIDTEATRLAAEIEAKLKAEEIEDAEEEVAEAA